MSDNGLTGRISFRVPQGLEDAVRRLAKDAGWDVSEIGRIVFTALWPEIESLIMVSRPSDDDAAIESNRVTAKLLRDARASGINLREVLVGALEDSLRRQAIGDDNGQGA